MKMEEEINQNSKAIKDSVSCPSVGKKNISLNISNDDCIYVLESTPKKDSDDTGYIHFEKMKSNFKFLNLTLQKNYKTN